MSEPNENQNAAPAAEGRCCGSRGMMPSKRKDFFAANAPAMPGWFMMEYVERNSKPTRFDPDGMSGAKANGVLLDAEVQWRWEFAEKMIRMERVRR